MPGFGQEQYNAHQVDALQSYGTGQAAVDYILSQRYGGVDGPAPAGRESFGRVVPGSGARCPSGVAADWDALPGRTGFEKFLSWVDRHNEEVVSEWSKMPGRTNREKNEAYDRVLKERARRNREAILGSSFPSTFDLRYRGLP